MDLQRIRCPACKDEYLLAFSCKGRGFCPSCCAKRSVLFGEFIRQKVLADCPHRHVVFSIPKMFRIFFLYNRKLLTELSRCAWKAIRQYLEVCSPEGTLPAGILSIATAGDFLNWNPHIHGLVSSGIFHADGSFVPAGLFQENVLRELFEAHVYKLLVSRELIGLGLIAKMRTWKHSGFHVYVGTAILQKEDAVRVGLYIVRAPASASRLQLTEDGLLKYLAKGSLPNDRCDSLFEPAGQIFDALEWIAKVTSHIPEKGAQLVHYYGAYSNAHRGKKAKSAASDVTSLPHSAEAEESETEWVKLRRKSWAALIRLVYESDPLLCPKCGTQMKIVSVIKDGEVIDKILAHLQYKFEPLSLAAARPPPDTPPQWDSFSTD
jgi:Putative transposase/Transposase zinc-binding domain